MGVQKVSLTPPQKKIGTKKSHMTPNLHIGSNIGISGLFGDKPDQKMQTRCLYGKGILKVLLPPKPIRMFGQKKAIFAPK